MVSCIVYTVWSKQTCKMIRFGLALLVAASALAAPSYESLYLTAVPENAVGPVRNSGHVNHLTDSLSRLIDGGDTNINVITFQNIINDLAVQRDSTSQTIALAQAIGTTLSLGTGRPGDSCVSAALIKAYTEGNPDSIRKHLSAFISHIGNNLEILVKLVTDPQAARFSIGPQSGCAGEGRSYDVDAAWDAILATANESNYGYLNEAYCTVKRMFYALSARSNNVAAVVTASSLPPVIQVYEQAFGSVVNLINALARNENCGQAVGSVRQAFAHALRNVSL